MRQRDPHGAAWQIALNAYTILALGAVILALGVAGAQSNASELKRPKLDPPGDTNSADVYYDFGIRVLKDKPAEAFRAFYWAARINPRMASAYYARHIAGFWQKPSLFLDLMRRHRRGERNREVRALDSLAMKAILLDPFVAPRLDHFFIELIQLHLNHGRPFVPDIFDPGERGWFALTQGRFYDAARDFADASVQDPKDEEFHVQRATALYYQGKFDGCVEELRRAMQAIDVRDGSRLVTVYASKAMYEYSAAHALLMAEDMSRAKEAYGRSATEDLSFYMAHVRLAAIAALEKDTAAALNEYETALQLRGDDPLVHYDYGVVLMQQGRYDEAIDQLHKAIELEPYFPQSYLALGVIEDSAGNEAKAREALEAFVAHVHSTFPGLDRVKKRITDLRGGSI